VTDDEPLPLRRVGRPGLQVTPIKIKPFNGQRAGRYKPGDRLLAFLDAL